MDECFFLVHLDHERSLVAGPLPWFARRLGEASDRQDIPREGTDRMPHHSVCP